MDIEQKDMYETYEFLPSSSTDNETEQFLVVENNGTFLLNMNKDVQYVSDLQDVSKVLESVQSCAVYDAATQQYYVDVENTSELITVTDQFILAEGEETDVYGNNYLLQSLPDNSTVQVPNPDPGTSEPNEEISELVVNQTINQIKPPEQIPESTLTEITLNDDQWKMLEEKGWVLLEFKEKIFLLNTLGLHDITDNKKMIEKFRREVAAVLQGESSKASGENISQSLFTDAASNIQKQTSSPLQSRNVTNSTENLAMFRVETIESKPQSSNMLQKIPIPASNTSGPTKSLLKPKPMSLLRPKPNKPKSVAKITQQKPKIYDRILRLKMPFKAADIPQKLILGKTVNGKNLVAKVVGVQYGVQGVHDESPKSLKKAEGPTELDTLFRQFVAVGSQITCRAEDVARAERIVKQLVAVPATRAPLLSCNLLVTMVQTTLDNNNVKKTGLPVFVTGRVSKQAQGENVFVYVPHMLQKIMNGSSEEGHLVTSDGTPPTLLHVHVEETMLKEGLPRTAITFSKKRLPSQLVSKRLPQLHACASCAQCFDSELDLLEHQTKCSLQKDSEPPPAIIKVDPDASKTPFRSSAKETVICKVCSAPVQFQNYRRHQRCHAMPKPGAPDAPFKCRMCPSTYYYSSSLSKHIMKQHIETQIKN